MRRLHFDKKGQPISAEEWSRLFEDMAYKRIAFTKLTEEVYVSTVWLGIDHGYSKNGPPIIFETMDFPEQEGERYCTQAEAMAGHEAYVVRLRERLAAEAARPRIVCLCGSTRFVDAYREANRVETEAGRIVLSVGFFGGAQDAGRLTPPLKQRLDQLHKKKIDLADEVLVLNVGGYVGESTKGEVEHARAAGKRVRWLEPVAGTEVN